MTNMNKYDGEYKAIIDNKKRKYNDNDIKHVKKQKNEKKNVLLGGENSVYSKNNHIYFISRVNTESINNLIEEIQKMNEDYENLKKNKLMKSFSPHPIYLHITSYGGSLFECMRAIDGIENSEIPVHTIIDGRAASCGSLMAVVGVKRYMTKSSYMLMHQLSSGVIGKYGEIEDEYLNCKKMMKDIIKIYLKKTNMKKSTIKKQLQHDSWWGYKDCLKNGLIDELWTS